MDDKSLMFNKISFNQLVLLLILFMSQYALASSDFFGRSYRSIRVVIRDNPSRLSALIQETGEERIEQIIRSFPPNLVLTNLDIELYKTIDSIDPGLIKNVVNLNPSQNFETCLVGSSEKSLEIRDGLAVVPDIDGGRDFDRTFGPYGDKPFGRDVFRHKKSCEEKHPLDAYKLVKIKKPLPDKDTYNRRIQGLLVEENYSDAYRLITEVSPLEIEIDFNAISSNGNRLLDNILESSDPEAIKIFSYTLYSPKNGYLKCLGKRSESYLGVLEIDFLEQDPNGNYLIEKYSGDPKRLSIIKGLMRVKFDNLRIKHLKDMPEDEEGKLNYLNDNIKSLNELILAEKLMKIPEERSLSSSDLRRMSLSFGLNSSMVRHATNQGNHYKDLLDTLEKSEHINSMSGQLLRQGLQELAHEREIEINDLSEDPDPYIKDIRKTRLRAQKDTSARVRALHSFSSVLDRINSTISKGNESLVDDSYLSRDDLISKIMYFDEELRDIELSRSEIKDLKNALIESENLFTLGFFKEDDLVANFLKNKQLILSKIERLQKGLLKRESNLLTLRGVAKERFEELPVSEDEVEKMIRTEELAQSKDLSVEEILSRTAKLSSDRDTLLEIPNLYNKMIERESLKIKKLNNCSNEASVQRKCNTLKSKLLERIQRYEEVNSKLINDYSLCEKVTSQNYCSKEKIDWDTRYRVSPHPTGDEGGEVLGGEGSGSEEPEEDKCPGPGCPSNDNTNGNSSRSNEPGTNETIFRIVGEGVHLFRNKDTGDFLELKIPPGEEQIVPKNFRLATPSEERRVRDDMNNREPEEQSKPPGGFLAFSTSIERADEHFTNLSKQRALGEKERKQKDVTSQVKESMDKLAQQSQSANDAANNSQQGLNESLSSNSSILNLSVDEINTVKSIVDIGLSLIGGSFYDLPNGLVQLLVSKNLLLLDSDKLNGVLDIIGAAVPLIDGWLLKGGRKLIHFMGSLVRNGMSIEGAQDMMKFAMSLPPWHWGRVEKIYKSAIDFGLKKTEQIKIFIKARAGEIRVHDGKQGKHVPGHNNFKPGKSEFTHPNAKDLIDKYSGKGHFYGNNKELVDFNENIGVWVGPDGMRLPTTRGTIHYSSKGDAHIVPAHPKGK